MTTFLMLLLSAFFFFLIILVLGHLHVGVILLLEDPFI